MKRFVLDRTPVVALLTVVCFSAPSRGADYRGVVAVDYSQDAGNEFYCANPSGSPVTTQAGVSISSPTLSLQNPFGSGKNLTLLDVGIDVTASPGAAVGFFLAYNVVPSSAVVLSTTPISSPVFSSVLVGKSTSTATSKSIAVCQVQGTLPNTPLAFRYIGGVAGAAAISPYLWTDLTDGKVVVPPGGLVSIQATASASVLAHLVWREDPL